MYAKNDDYIEGLQSTLKIFRDDIGMEFGLEKCSKVTFKKDTPIKPEDVALDINTETV